MTDLAKYKHELGATKMRTGVSLSTKSFARQVLIESHAGFGCSSNKRPLRRTCNWDAGDIIISSRSERAPTEMRAAARINHPSVRALAECAIRALQTIHRSRINRETNASQPLNTLVMHPTQREREREKTTYI